MLTRYLYIGLCCFGITLNSPISAQSVSQGMLGDQLDLYGVLDLFKNAENTEDFERLLNSETNKVNNLDLNNDGQIDYIRVVDYPDGDNHAIVLQAPINATESQDLAVLELERTSDGQAHIQIIGNEDLYGPDYIVEPIEPQVQDARSYGQAYNTYNTNVIVNVWGWRPIRYYYGPVYRPWVSPWSWAYYPTWWRPWAPVGWYVYRPRVYPYHGYCHQVYVRRSPHMQAFYSPRRVSSSFVYNNRGAYHRHYYNNYNGQGYGHGYNHGYNHGYGNNNIQYHGNYTHNNSGGAYNHAPSGGAYHHGTSGGSYNHGSSGGTYHNSSGGSYNHAPSGGGYHQSGGSYNYGSSGGTNHTSTGGAYNHAPSGGSNHSSSGGSYSHGGGRR